MSKNSLLGTDWYWGRVQVANTWWRALSEPCKENGLRHFHRK